MHKCSSCSQEKAASEFHRDRTKRTGLASTCKACRKKYNSNYNEANAPRLRAQRREKYRNLPTQDKERSLSKLRSWTKVNSAKINQYSREQKAAKRAANAMYPPVSKSADIFKKCGRCKLNLPTTKYGRNRCMDDGLQSHCYDCQSVNRHARRKGYRFDSFNHVDWLSILRKYGNACVYCGNTEQLTKDHVVPLSKDGSNTADNLVPACMSCNASKGNRCVHVWVIERFGEGHPVLRVLGNVSGTR